MRFLRGSERRVLIDCGGGQASKAKYSLRATELRETHFQGGKHNKTNLQYIVMTMLWEFNCDIFHPLHKDFLRYVEHKYGGLTNNRFCGAP